MENSETLLLEVRPSWWHFTVHFIFFWLLFIPLIVAFWKRAALKLQVYEDRVVLETGVLNKSTKDIFLSDIRSIDTTQTFFQRLVEIGDIKIATAGTGNYECIARGVPDPVGIRALIKTQRQKQTDKIDSE